MGSPSALFADWVDPDPASVSGREETWVGLCASSSASTNSVSSDPAPIQMSTESAVTGCVDRVCMAANVCPSLTGHAISQTMPPGSCHVGSDVQGCVVETITGNCPEPASSGVSLDEPAVSDGDRPEPAGPSGSRVESSDNPVQRSFVSIGVRSELVVAGLVFASVPTVLFGQSNGKPSGILPSRPASR